MNEKVVQRMQWRRDKVKELSVKGHSQRQIASILKIALGTVEDDLAHLRQNARDNISKYIEEYLPAEYENCLNGLNDILQAAWTLSTDADSDKRERMQALSLAKECYAMKLDLLSSATVVDRAVKFVDRNRNRNQGLTTENKEVRSDVSTFVNEKSDSISSTI